jgi:DNA polymerase (family X)
MKKRQEYYKKHHAKWLEKVKNKVGLFVMCEVDILPDGKLALPDKAFEYVDAVIASIHSSFAQSREDMTKRVLAALTASPKVRIFGHPTTRLLGKREGVEYNWEAIFDVCNERDIALEINASPLRLDLPDSIVFDAKKRGIKFCIDTDSHASSQMGIMRYGVSVARRGWATKYDIVNCMEYNKFRNWLVI